MKPIHLFYITLAAALMIALLLIFQSPQPPTPPPATNTPSPVPTYTCDCARTCDQITSCREAYYQLEHCGCTRRDADRDGVPCESICR